MCECLLENYEKADMPEDAHGSEVCELQVHTRYKLGLDATDATGFVPHAEAQAEVCARWEEK